MNKFVRKSPAGNVYIWEPDTSLNGGVRMVKGKPTFCNAVANGGGEDFIVKYVYDSTFDRLHNEHRIPYVECGYVG